MVVGQTKFKYFSFPFLFSHENSVHPSPRAPTPIGTTLEWGAHHHERPLQLEPLAMGSPLPRAPSPIGTPCQSGPHCCACQVGVRQTAVPREDPDRDHPDLPCQYITPSRYGRGGAPQSTIAIDTALRYSANSYNKRILSFPNNCSIQRFTRHCAYLRGGR